MRRTFWIPVAALMSLAACSLPSAEIHGIRPTYPTAWDPILGLPMMKEPHPLFTWEPVDEPGVKYDFVVYEAYNIDPALGEWAIGRKVYYRNRLSAPQHELEISLQPGRNYYWSVRVRRGESVSPWSGFSFKRCPWEANGMCNTDRHPFFLLRTSR